MNDWHWEPHPEKLLDDLPPEARSELDQLARDITVRDAMIYLDGRDYEGPGPGLQIESKGRLMVSYLTDVRGEFVIILHMACGSRPTGKSGLRYRARAEIPKTIYRESSAFLSRS